MVTFFRFFILSSGLSGQNKLFISEDNTPSLVILFISMYKNICLILGLNI